MLGLTETLSGKCNDLCGFVSACVRACVSIPQSTVPITLGLSGGLGCVRRGETAGEFCSHSAAAEERDRVTASPNLDSPSLDEDTRGAALWED